MPYPQNTPFSQLVQNTNNQGGLWNSLKNLAALPGAWMNANNANMNAQSTADKLAFKVGSTGQTNFDPNTQAPVKNASAPGGIALNSTKLPTDATGNTGSVKGNIVNNLQNQQNQQDQQAKNTFNGGVNSSGQGLPGYNPFANQVSGSSTTNSQSQIPQDNSQAAQPIQPDRFAQLNALIQNLSSQGQPTAQQQDLIDRISKLQESQGLGMAKIAGTPEPLDLQTGQSNVLLQQGLARINPLVNQLGNLQGIRQLGLQGLQSALGGAQTGITASQPVVLGLGQALVSPTTGQTVAGNASYTGSGANGGGSALIDSAIQQLKNGAGYSDVVSQLPGGLAPMLLSEAQRQIPGFNITTSNQNAQARGSALQANTSQGLTLQRSGDSANKALDSLEQAFSSLPGAATGGIPATNSIVSWLGQQFGNTAVSQFETYLHDARAQLSGVLTATGAVPPTSADAMAQSYLPDGMTPDQFKTKIAAARNLISQKVSSFTTPGNVPQYGNQGGQNNQGSSGGGAWSW